MRARNIAPVALLCVLALVAAGCGKGESEATAASEQGPPKRGGSIIIGLDQEPACLNQMLTCGGMAAASYVTNTMLQGWVQTDEHGDFFPQMITEVPTLENGGVKLVGKGMTVTMQIRDGVHWSDEHPITCEDFEFRWQVTMNKEYLIGNKLGYDKITSVDCSDPKKIIVHMSEPFAPYIEALLTKPPLPKHALEGKDFNKYWNDKITVGNGPFVFVAWHRNVEIIVKRNPHYWNAGAENKPYLDKIRFKFIRDTNTIKIQLRTGEVDYIQPAPDTSLAEEIKSFPRSNFQVRPGTFWEHVAFQTAHWPLGDLNVRKALAHSIDRKTITEVVLRNQVKQLDSTLLPDVEEYYKPAWKRYDFAPKKVKKYMLQAGFKRSGKGLWKKNGKSVDLEFKSTAGNALRMRVAQLLQEQFRLNGFDLKIVLEQPGVLFSQSVPRSVFDLGEWARSSTIDPSQNILFACDQIPKKSNQWAGSNNYQYCNEEVTAALKEADRTVDLAKRQKLVAFVQEQMAKDVPLVPLYQRPEVVAYSQRLHGVKNNPVAFQTWNTADWWVSSD